MKKCDCGERVGTKIISISQFEDLKKFFDKQNESGIFCEIPVEEPYYVGRDIHGNTMEWYADKRYKCLKCGVIWEFCYPDFPAAGFVKKG